VSIRIGYVHKKICGLIEFREIRRSKRRSLLRGVMNPYIPHLLFGLGDIRHKRYAHSAVERFESSLNVEDAIVISAYLSQSTPFAVLSRILRKRDGIGFI